MARRQRGEESGAGENASGQGRGSSRGRRQPRAQRRDRSATAARRAVGAQGQGRNLMPWLIGGLVGAMVVGLVGFLVFQEVTKEWPGIAMADQGNRHVATVEEEHIPYNSSPPTSGPHLGGGLAPANIYGQQQADELQAHSLEDGHVIVQYDCGDEDCSNLILQLTSVVQRTIGEQKRVLLAPYTPILHPETGASHRIALTAWTRIDVFDDFDEERITKFIDAYEGLDHHVRG